MTITPDEVARLSAAIAAAGDVAYEWTLADDVIAWVGPVAHLFGSAGGNIALTGESLNARVNAEDLPSRLKLLADAAGLAHGYDCEYRLRRADGAFCWVHDRGRAELSQDGKAICLRGMLRIVDRRKAHEARLELQANFDEMTGLFNRARLRDALQQGILHSQRYRGTGGYLLVGIDGLGAVNEAFGFPAADAVILEAGQRLERLVRASDVVGRVGGDQFGIVLNQCAEIDLDRVAEKILDRFRDQPIHTPAGLIQIAVSVGAIAFPEFVKTGFEAMELAEAALAEAKRAGRDRAVRHRPTPDQQREHLDMLRIGAQVRKTFDEDGFMLAFQPVVDADTGAVRFHECLLRMLGPDGAVVSAGKFIPVIERLDMARLVDRRVLEMTVRELGPHPELRLSMNISGITASDRSWLRSIVALLRDRPQVAQRLIVEITETAAIQDMEETARFIATVRELGCKMALDDFGAGFISMRHLKSLAVDIVKIDGSYVRGLMDRADNLHFVRSLVSSAHGFGVETVAECVETAEDADMLKREGVRLMQGWHFGRPSTERPWATRPAIVMI